MRREQSSVAPEVSAPRHDFAVVSSDDIYTGKVLAVRRDDVRMPAGGTSVREIMEHAGAVAIAALDADDRLMMIYQYRHALERRLWEMPAGLLDVAGEDPRWRRRSASWPRRSAWPPTSGRC